MKKDSEWSPGTNVAIDFNRQLSVVFHFKLSSKFLWSDKSFLFTYIGNKQVRLMSRFMFYTILNKFFILVWIHLICKFFFLQLARLVLHIFDMMNMIKGSYPAVTLFTWYFYFFFIIQAKSRHQFFDRLLGGLLMMILELRASISGFRWSTKRARKSL